MAPSAERTTSQRRESLSRRIVLALWKSMVRMSPRSQALGIDLCAMSLPDSMEKVFFGRVGRALRLIDRYEPRRLTQIHRDVSMIVGSPGGSNHYNPTSRAVVLTWPTVLQRDAAHLAMTIIHEATHARIEEFGIAYDEPLRGRIEAICVEQEAAFARCLPSGEEMAAQRLKALETPWWKPEDLVRYQLEEGRAHEIPEWILRIIAWGARRRVRGPGGTTSADAN